MTHHIVTRREFHILTLRGLLARCSDLASFGGVTPAGREQNGVLL